MSRLARILGPSVLKESKRRGLVVVEPDGVNVAVITRLDVVEFYHGRKNYVSFSISSKNAWRIARYIMWHYAVRLWFGLRVRLFWWLMRTRLRKQAERVM